MSDYATLIRPTLLIYPQEGRADTQVRPYNPPAPLVRGERSSAVPLRRGIEGVVFQRRGKEKTERVNE